MRTKKTQDKKTQLRRSPHSPPKAEVFAKWFAEWYETYLRKWDRGAAEKAYPKAVAKVAKEHKCTHAEAHAVLLEAAKPYAIAMVGTEQRFKKHPSTRLNKEA